VHRDEVVAAAQAKQQQWRIGHTQDNKTIYNQKKEAATRPETHNKQKQSSCQAAAE
jgi:hypothetical protein